MHIDLDRWKTALQETLEVLEKQLAEINDEKTLFEVELNIAKFAFISRKLCENFNVKISEKEETASKFAKEKSIKLRFAKRKEESNIWQNVSVESAYDLNAKSFESYEKDLEYIFNQIIHATRFDTGKVEGFGYSILLASDTMSKKKIYIIPKDEIIDLFKEFSSLEFVYKLNQ